MKRLFSYLPKKLLAVFVALAVMVGVGVAVQATFGPDRPTFTWDKPATYVTFNSMTNNPVVGDERTFMKGAKPGATSFTDPVTGVVDGEEVTVQMYVHNNAASNLGLKANNTTVRVALPTGSKQIQQLTGYISADNANPQTVTDTLDISAVNNGYMEIAYVPGSASYKNNKGTFKLADTIVTTGAQVGYDQMNGVVPGCEEFSGWVTMRVKINMPHYVVQKSARLAGEGADKWRESVNAKLGDTIEWRIEVRNIGSTTLNNIIVLDELPPYMTAEAGSVKLINSNHPSTNPYVYPASAIQQKDGKIYVNVDAGDYAPNSNGYVRFSSKIVSDPKISCDNQKLTNKAYATPKGYGTVSSYAYVIVVNDKPCTEPEKPVYSCDSLNVKVIGDRKISATLAYTAKSGATFNNATYSFGDNSQNLVTKDTTVEHTYSKYGTYTVKVVPTFMVDGKVVTAAENAACTKQVTLDEKPLPPVYSCDALKVDVIGSRKVKATVTYTAQNGATLNNISYDFGDSSQKLVTKEATAEHTYAADGSYTIRATVNFNVDGKVVPADSSACAKIVTFDKGEEVTPTPPTTTPSTGPAETIGLFIGATAISAIGYRLWMIRRLGN